MPPASAGIDLLDVPFLNLEDEQGLRQEATACARLGFTGKASIHPNQIPIIHAAFTPDAKAIEKARKVCAAFENDNTGLVVVDGELIELPVGTLDVSDPRYFRTPEQSSVKTTTDSHSHHEDTKDTKKHEEKRRRTG
jgi:hypothetical protein